MSPLALAALMVAAGLLHFVIPRSYQRIVPRFLGHAALLVAASGIVEMLSGGLIAVPRTRRAGAALAFAVLVLVWPANVQMALDGGLPDRVSTTVAWIRVPLQIPLLVWAWRVARRAPAPG